jgi:membrane fusion protein, multidrug efflux system
MPTNPTAPNAVTDTVATAPPARAQPAGDMKEPPKKRIWVRFLTVLAIAAAAAYIASTGLAVRQASFAKLRETAEARALPVVIAAQPSPQGSTITLDLPGRLEAYARAALFARVNGYLASWKAEIGTAVKSGELLAEIDAPELDQQLLQAKSELVNAETAAKLAEVTNQRFQALLPNQAISKQVADEKASDLAVRRAQVKSAEANVERLKSMTQYKRIVAPFDGVVTARNTDVGALINAGSSTGNGLFVVSDTHMLRLYVNVPQSSAPLIKVGATAKVTVPERPGKTFSAKVEALSGAVDVASGSMRTQLAVDNADRLLLPGGYANVHFEVPSLGNILSVPASAVIFDKAGLRVAVVDAEGRVTLKSITIARDAGKTVDIGSGLLKDDRVIESPPDGVVDGDKVIAKAPPPPTPPAPTSGAPVPAAPPASAAAPPAPAAAAK